MGKIRTLRTVAHAQRTIIALTLAAGIVGGASGQTTASMFGTLFSGVYCSIFTCEETAPVQPVTTQQWTGTTPQAQGQIREHPVWVNAPAPAAAQWQQVGGNAWNVGTTPALYGAPQQSLNPPFPELPRPGAVPQPQHAPVPPMQPPMQVRINQWNDPESLCSLPWVDCPGRESTTGVNTQGGDSGAQWTGGSSTSPQGGNTVDGQTGGGWWNVDQVDDFSTEYEFINVDEHPAAGRRAFPVNRREDDECNDGDDNDSDGGRDGSDPECQALHEGNGADGSCYDGGDNDVRNFMTDVIDPQCWGLEGEAAASHSAAGEVHEQQIIPGDFY